jgi:cob(I)alamin adenosyltransferase
MGGYNCGMSDYYTRTGDDGFTGLLGEGRLPKYHLRMEAVGTVDEATAALGIARSVCREEKTRSILLATQRDLYHLMAELSATPENATRFRVIDEEKVRWLETQSDAVGAQVKMPKEFIIPGDTPAGAALDLARAVVRRAERLLAQLLHNLEIENLQLLRYLNRLSSLCFVLELFENQAAGQTTPTLAKD